MRNKANLLLVMFAVLLASIATVSAANFNINHVEVNDVDMAGKTLNVERDELLDIEVEMTCTNATDRVVVSAEIDGYEYGSIEDKTPLFNCEVGNTYKKRLQIQVPFDLDSSETYSLHIEASDRQDRTEQDIPLFTEEQRNNVNLYDIITNPVNNVQAGSPVFVTVRLENLGQKKQDNVKVTATVPELGITATGYLNDDLITEEQEDNQRFNDAEEQSDSITLMLRVPEDAQTGNYNINVVTEYNRGHDFTTGVRSIFVQGAKEQPKQAEVLVTVDSNNKDVSMDQETAYRLMFANVGGEAGLYSVQIDGEDSWAYSRVEPGFVQLNGGSTGEAAVYLKAKPEAKAGTYTFVARVMQGNNVVKEITLYGKTGTDRSSASVDTRVVLAGIFVLLVVVLIVLAIIMASKRTSGRKPEESTTTTTTYY
ncbi:MAG TPA: hypothetical protein VJB87_04145 [Candidatus Nanoarchaeia archaeon]|nr:hypothetical protein [Candidatus Nanoarchaeia archaeon]